MKSNFTEKIDNTWLFNNNKVFLSYQKYLASETCFDEVLSFGDHPLKYHQKLLNNNNSKLKGLDYDENLQMRKDKIKSSEDIINQLPVLKFPFNTSSMEESNENELALIRYCKENNFNSNSNPNINNNEGEGEEMKVICKICNSKFNSFQGLGGHMGQAHRLKSEQFQKRKMIRARNSHKRMLNQTAKKLLCFKNNIDYDTMIQSREGKSKLKKFLKNNKKELMLFKCNIIRINQNELPII